MAERNFILRHIFHKVNLFACWDGCSGAGKTTLLCFLSGLGYPKSGYIKVGDEVWFDSKSKKFVKPQDRRVAYMFQDLALFPNMNVEQNIRYAQRKKDHQKIAELISVFGLGLLATQKVNFLSGGQKQRVALARALASYPHLLLLDEPLSAIDEDMRPILLTEIMKAHQYLGVTTIMVTHNRAEAEKVATMIIRIKNGKII